MKSTWWLTGWLAPALAAIALSLAVPHALAQTPALVPVPKSTPSDDHAVPPAATREDLQNTLETLRDPEKRDALAKQIETLLQVQQAEPTPPPEEQGIGARLLGAFSTGFQQVSDFMERAGRAFGASGHLLAWLKLQGSDPIQRAMWLGIGRDLALSLGAGLVAAYAINLAVRV